MREEVLLSFRRIQPRLCREWERRLRQEPVPSPLASPDLLVYLMGWTLESVWETLCTGRDHSLENAALSWVDHCHCKANPLTYYFLTVKDVCRDVLEREPKAFPAMTLAEKQTCSLELLRALDQVAEREIKTFCAVCQRTSSNQAASKGTSDLRLRTESATKSVCPP